MHYIEELLTRARNLQLINISLLKFKKVQTNKNLALASFNLFSELSRGASLYL